MLRGKKDGYSFKKSQLGGKKDRETNRREGRSLALRRRGEEKKNTGVKGSESLGKVDTLEETVYFRRRGLLNGK